MKLTDLVAHLATETGMDRKAARKAVDCILAGLVDTVKKGEEVVLPGFGRFKVKDMPARQGRNPASGETIEIAAGRKLTFTPAPQLKTAIQG